MATLSDGGAGAGFICDVGLCWTHSRGPVWSVFLAWDHVMVGKTRIMKRTRTTSVIGSNALLRFTRKDGTNSFADDPKLASCHEPSLCRNSNCTTQSKAIGAALSMSCTRTRASSPDYPCQTWLPQLHVTVSVGCCLVNCFPADGARFSHHIGHDLYSSTESLEFKSRSYRPGSDLSGQERSHHARFVPCQLLRHG